MTDLSDDDLLAELGASAEPPKVAGRTPREERIIAGFEDILRFFETHGRTPRHGEDLDIFERLYAVRLSRLRAMPDAQSLLAEFDTHGLLAGVESPGGASGRLDDDALLAEIDTGPGNGDIRVLKNVRSFEERQVEEEIAGRTRCSDFNRFEPLFERVERELKTGVRHTRRFGRDASVEPGNFFILGGQIVYVAEVGERIRTPNGEENGRMRVIYSNGTESNLLIRSLQRALYKDEAGRRLTDPSPGPLFSGEPEEDDIASGTVYVLRSKSGHPFVMANRDLIHKIGVTGGDVETRIARAIHDATYMLAEVEIVATYRLSNISRTKLENLFHRLFAPAQLDITIEDRFGQPVKPREWFLVPLSVIDEAIGRLLDGSITGMRYDPATASLIGAAEVEARTAE